MGACTSRQLPEQETGYPNKKGAGILLANRQKNAKKKTRKTSNNNNNNNENSHQSEDVKSRSVKNKDGGELNGKNSVNSLLRDNKMGKINSKEKFVINKLDKSPSVRRRYFVNSDVKTNTATTKSTDPDKKTTATNSSFVDVKKISENKNQVENIPTTCENAATLNKSLLLASPGKVDQKSPTEDDDKIEEVIEEIIEITVEEQILPEKFYQTDIIKIREEPCTKQQFCHNDKDEKAPEASVDESRDKNVQSSLANTKDNSSKSDFALKTKLNKQRLKLTNENLQTPQSLIKFNVNNAAISNASHAQQYDTVSKADTSNNAQNSNHIVTNKSQTQQNNLPVKDKHEEIAESETIHLKHSVREDKILPEEEGFVEKSTDENLLKCTEREEGRKLARNEIMKEEHIEHLESHVGEQKEIGQKSNENKVDIAITTKVMKPQVSQLATETDVITLHHKSKPAQKVNLSNEKANEISSKIVEAAIQCVYDEISKIILDGKNSPQAFECHKYLEFEKGSFKSTDSFSNCVENSDKSQLEDVSKSINDEEATAMKVFRNINDDCEMEINEFARSFTSSILRKVVNETNDDIVNEKEANYQIKIKQNNESFEELSRKPYQEPMSKYKKFILQKFSERMVEKIMVRTFEETFQTPVINEATTGWINDNAERLSEAILIESISDLEKEFKTLENHITNENSIIVEYNVSENKCRETFVKEFTDENSSIKKKLQTDVQIKNENENKKAGHRNNYDQQKKGNDFNHQLAISQTEHREKENDKRNLASTHKNSDRPLSGYAEKLAMFLADEDELEFETDEELNETSQNLNLRNQKEIISSSNNETSCINDSHEENITVNGYIDSCPDKKTHNYEENKEDQSILNENSDAPSQPIYPKLHMTEEENNIRFNGSVNTKEATANENFLKIKSKSDRPLSGYAEKLAMLLAEEEEEFDFESDEELSESLQKIKTNYGPDRRISVEIHNVQELYSNEQINNYKAKDLKTKMRKHKDNKVRGRNKKLRGDRPISLYAQDMLEDLFCGEDEENFDEAEEESVGISRNGPNRKFDSVGNDFDRSTDINFNNDDGSNLEDDEKDDLDSEEDVLEDEIQPVSEMVVLLENQIPMMKQTSITTDYKDYAVSNDATKGSSFDKGTITSIANGGPPVSTRAAVIDAGCGILKAGISGEVRPSCYCPSVIGVPRRFSQDISKMKKAYYVGDDAWSVAGMLQIEYPIKQNINNWSDVTNIIEYLLDEELDVSDGTHPVLMTEMSLCPKKRREKLTEIMFERFGIPSFYLANQSTMAMYSKGLVSGVSLTSGFYHTQATPVYEGHAIPHATTQLDIGGDHVTSCLGRQIMNTQGTMFNSSSEKLVLNSMKQRLCYIASDPLEESEKYKMKSDMFEMFTLPDGQTIDLGTERFIAPEILFDPNIIGLQQPNVAELIPESLQHFGSELHGLFTSNILVSGGNTKLKGFGTRFERELQKMSNNVMPTVKYADDAILSTWIGASILASIDGFRSQWISMEEYVERGASMVHMFCF